MDKIQEISSFINEIKNEIITQRSMDVKNRIENNIKKSICYTEELEKSSKRINNSDTNMLIKRMRDAIGMSTPVVLPQEDPLPPFITWIFLSRNHGMREDQSITNQRILYHDTSGEIINSDDLDDETIDDETDETIPAPTKRGEIINCDDLDDETPTKREFLKSEDHILRKTITAYGCQNDVINILAKCLKMKTNEVKERYEVLVNEETIAKEGECNDGIRNIFDEDLDGAMNAYNKLFCRRCYAFNCRTHGPFDALILPVDKQTPWCPTNEESISCSPNCFKLDKIGEKISLSPWTPFEETLYDKSAEIFGNNSCLIANIMDGQKTCWEIHQYGLSKTEDNDREIAKRKSGPSKRMRGLKFSLYSANEFSAATANKTSGLFRHYVACKCTTSCNKHCPCSRKWPCDKYCGCPKTCGKRYKGCKCKRGQCSTNKCPCFASERECDPDLCSNCKVGCGDGSLGYFDPGQANECGNMKFLLRQHQKILLGISDVSGWGAFVKDNVGKDEFLGEYTGEIISNDEANARGTLYDKINKSYLFNLDDQFVSDAYRKGDKLKFVNHSRSYNCYPRILKVGGDYRVGLYANEDIKSGEELVFDYNYEIESYPKWALELLEYGGQKKKNGASSSGAIKKHARKGISRSHYAIEDKPA